MPREDLLKLQITVGNAKMTGIFDTGSQINIMSRNLVEKTGVPLSSMRKETGII